MMATLDGCYTITAQDIDSGTALITTGHTSAGGQATCQTTKPRPAYYSKVPRMASRSNPHKPIQRVLHQVTVLDGDLAVPVIGLHEGERICWLSWDS